MASRILNLNSSREVSGQVHDPWYVLDWLLIGLAPLLSGRFEEQASLMAGGKNFLPRSYSQ